MIDTYQLQSDTNQYLSMSNRSVPIIRLFQPSAIAKVTALWHTNHGSLHTQQDNSFAIGGA